MDQIQINKKEHELSATGRKKPWFRTFPKMLSHLGRAEGPREPGAWAVREESKVAVSYLTAHGPQAPLSGTVGFNSVCIKDQYSIISKR